MAKRWVARRCASPWWFLRVRLALKITYGLELISLCFINKQFFVYREIPKMTTTYLITMLHSKFGDRINVCLFWEWDKQNRQMLLIFVDICTVLTFRIWSGIFVFMIFYTAHFKLIQSTSINCDCNKNCSFRRYFIGLVYNIYAVRQSVKVQIEVIKWLIEKISLVII